MPELGRKIFRLGFTNKSQQCMVWLSVTVRFPLVSPSFHKQVKRVFQHESLQSPAVWRTKKRTGRPWRDYLPSLWIICRWLRAMYEGISFSCFLNPIFLQTFDQNATIQNSSSSGWVILFPSFPHSSNTMFQGKIKANSHAGVETELTSPSQK